MIQSLNATVQVVVFLDRGQSYNAKSQCKQTV